MLHKERDGENAIPVGSVKRGCHSLNCERARSVKAGGERVRALGPASCPPRALRCVPWAHSQHRPRPHPTTVLRVYPPACPAVTALLPRDPRHSVHSLNAVSSPLCPALRCSLTFSEAPQMGRAWMRKGPLPVAGMSHVPRTPQVTGEHVWKGPARAGLLGLT